MSELQSSVDDLYTEIEQVSQAFEDMQEQNGRLVKQIQQSEDAKTSLLAQQVRGRHLEEQQKLALDKSTLRIAELEKLVNDLKRVVDDTTQESRSQAMLLEQTIKRANQATQMAESLRAELSYVARARRVERDVTVAGSILTCGACARQDGDLERTRERAAVEATLGFDR